MMEMMIYANAGSGPDAVDAAVTSGPKPTEMVSADVAGKLPPALTPQASFMQRVITLDSNGQSLRLWADTTLRLDLLHQEFEVEGWGLRMKMNEVVELPREMARQFLQLWSRSERGQLQEREKEYWKGIVERVDFQAFCNERTSYRYAEGELVERTRDGARVKWADEREEILRGRPGRALDWVNPGEMFSASVKLDRTGRVHAMENCTVLGRAKELLQEVDDDWIQKV